MSPRRKIKVGEAILTLQIRKLPEGQYLATNSALPGLVAQGRTVAETIEIAQDVARKLIESYLEHGDPLPPALTRSLRQNDKKLTVQIPIAVNF